MATVLLLSSTLMVTSLNAQAWAVPGPGMTREEVELPDLPKNTPVDGDEEAEKNLTTAPEVPVDPYAPTAVTPWTENSGTATLSPDTAAGTTVPVSNGLPVALGAPEGTDPAALAGEWQVDLAAPAASQEAGVSGLIMQVTPPATADPAAQVALTVDTTSFADLYGPQAADRFGLVLLPECVLTSPDSGDCAAEGGVQTMLGTADNDTAELLRSTVEVVPAKEAPTKAKAPKNATTHKILTGSVPVADLLGGAAADTDSSSGSGGTPSPNSPEPSGASARTASARTVSAHTDALQAVDASGPQVIGAMDTGASAGGDFTATPLLSAGSWSAGASSGAFTYGYQVQVPETAGGPMPKIALSYSSQSVDGRTSATNNQASWIGDGWDYNPGSITRTYANCREDSKKSGSNNAKHRTADQCWGSDNATLSLGGMTTELVWDETQKEWFTANGDGSRIERIRDDKSGNGAKDGEYWVVTTRDGTRYHFGKHKLPGWTEGQPVTDSVLTVPVYGNHLGEDCYKSGDWPGSWCTQGWRWNLDYVEDVHGNAMSLWWKTEQNYYARNFNFKAPVVYDRGGYLSRIDYGQRKESIFSTPAPARVTFKVEERCLAEGSLTCSDENFEDKDPGKYRIWYDTPADLNCKKVTSTYKTKCWNAGPTFWTRKRLTEIQTSAQRRTDTDARQVVDRYALTQSFPVLRTGPNTALWLESIQRTGFAREGSTDESVTLNAVRFESNADDMPNRVMRPDDPRPGFSRLRIARVINEYGGETVVTYKPATGDCATGTGLPGKKDTAALKSNTRLCYPQFWHPDPEVEDIDWFHKYVVESIEELPNVDGAFATQTAYAYKNAGWRLAESEFTKKSTRTYSQFAGFEQTTVITGTDEPSVGSKKSKAVTRYFRGMGDDVPVKDITGAEIAKDLEPFAGRIAEELTYTSASDADTDWLSRSVTVPAATELGKRDRDDGLSPLRAWRVTEPEEFAYTKSSGTGDDTRTERVVRSKTTFEPTHGLPTQVESLGDTGKSGDESCTKLEYLHHTGKNLIGLTKQALVSPTTCANADFTDLSTLSGATRTAYDNTAYGTALADTTRGLATQTWSLNGTGTGFQDNGTSKFDAVGRVVRQTDPDGNFGTIEYNPPTGQVFEIIETNAAGHTQKQEVEPGRSTAVKTTDANGRVSEATYDPLGRLVEAWGPGRTPSASAVPDFKAVYTVPQYDPDNPDRKPPFVTTHTRGHNDRVETSVVLYDGLGRERQTQEEADGGGHLITDTLYNSSGEVWQTNNAYLTHEAESGELFTPLADTAVPNITRYTYDGLGRVVTEMPVLKVVDPETKEATSEPVPERATRYEYGQDWSKVIHPTGASSYRVYTDALGRTSRVDTFTPDAPGGHTSMRYSYDRHGQLVKAVNSVDPAHPWTWTYDHRGRQVTSTDPDTGTTSTTYDHRDRPLTTENARGVTVWNGYDALSRPIEQRLDSAAGKLLASFGYDSAPGGKGMPATATRYTDGAAYTQQVDGYTEDYQPTSTTLTLPQALADTWGLKTSYTYGYTYTDTGALKEASLPAVGRFDAEKLVVRYNKDGKPLSVSGKDWYGAETVYDSYGQVLRSTLGAQPYRVWTQASYDEGSGELKDHSVYREQTGDKAVVGGHLVSNRSYTYDPAGNITAIREHADGIAERQCFAYDPLGQLKTAWTAKDQTACAAPDGGGTGTPNVAAGTDNTGYWQEYEYDLAGNRTKLTEKDLGGDAAKDATTTYSYGKADGTQPHTLTKVSKTYTTPQGAQVKAEAERLYALTGETTSVTSLQNGDKQELSWTYDGKIDRIKGQGAGGKTPYVGLADKCLDLKSGLAAAGQPVQLYACNTSPAQSWRFTPTPGTEQADADRGTLAVHDEWCLAPAANTAGSAVQVRKCDGSAGQELRRNTSGQLTHIASGLCLAVKDANSASSTPVVLAACDAAKSEQQWAPQKDTRYVYGPDGAQLLTIKGKQATLHLGEAEVTVQQGGVLVNTQRTYSAPGGAVMRYAYGNGTEQLVALAGDHQGSTYAEVALRDEMSVRIRKQDPFGNQRGGGTVGVGQQSHTGFLGATRDDSSGYQPLGARLYDPVVGRFLSADPVLDLNDLLQSNGYAYAHNNPVTMSDPTGLAITLTASERAAALAGAGLSAAAVAQAQSMMGKSLSSVILDAAWSTLKDFIGINDAMACFGGDMWSCAGMVLGAIPWFKAGKIPGVLKAIDRTIDAIQAFRKAKKAAEAVLKAAKAAEAAALKAKKAAIEKAKKEAAQRAKKKAAEQAKRTSDKAVAQTKKTGNPVQKQAQAKSAPKASSVSKGSGGKGGGSKPGGDSGGSSRSKGGSSGSGDSGKADGGGSCPVGNSFVPGTRVLMADGTTKPIEKVKAGDKVIATDPKTGERRIETVTAEIKGEGLKHLVKVTIDTDGDKGTKTASVTATDGHPFWVPELDAWIDATDLHSGQWLRTSAGTHVQITAVKRWTTPGTTVHNLTVGNTHTYYALAGATPVLVHNCGETVLYRSPAEGKRASEALGLNADNHSGPHPTAYLSNKPEGAAQYAGNGHDMGFHRFVMKPGFREAFGDLEFELPNSNGVTGLTEWRIPAGRIEEFNSYIDHSKTQWWDAALGHFYPPSG
ncbi:ricin-type beta-trefoil lectin domain protein [Streptomyces sp. NPDC086080]|uniref:ricin-type beta-trefoil lectin domain protein n=1 Tax=Streptomyces sp. NPDC086080 TaxID=3365748 RepID=UPI0037D2BEEA